MIKAAVMRAIRAHLGDTQPEFAKRFNDIDSTITRYTVMNWERYGIVDDHLERRILDLEGPFHESAGKILDVGGN